ncbi:MAG: integrase, partial [Amphritea sp.]|nr:integrase [Amphritea sp.]
MQKVLADYLAMRRGLGFKLISEAKLLKTFVSFFEQGKQDIITTEFALTWAKLSTTTMPVRRARRLSVVRSFARYCRVLEPKTEVPPDDLLPCDYQRPTPFLFKNDDIRLLLEASQKRVLNGCFFGQTLTCLFGLLSV